MSGTVVVLTGEASFQELRAGREGVSGASAFFPEIISTGLSKREAGVSKQIVVRDTVDAKVFGALSDAKIETSRIAAHISDGLRKQLFAALDSLHDVEEWDEGDEPIILRSYKTFLSFLLIVQPTLWPSFGMTGWGRIFTSWGLDSSRINLEFLEDGRTQWSIVSETDEGEPIRSVGIAPANTIVSYIMPFKLEQWFGSFKS